MSARTSTSSKSSPLQCVMVTAAVIVLGLFLATLLSLGVALGVRAHWISPAWFQDLTQKQYNKDGIQFSYYRDWRIVEHPADAPTHGYTMRYGRLFRTTQDHAPTLNLEGPHGAALTFALFDPTYDESLQTYSERIRTSYAAALGDAVTDTGPLEPVTCPIHGTNYDGFRYHFTVRPSASTMTSRYQYFFQMRTPAHKIFFSMQLPEQFVAAPGVNLVLDSMRLDGEINPASPIDYHLVDFENLAESAKAVNSTIQHLKASGAATEDLAVVTAWNQTLTDFIAAENTFDKARSDFESADILNLRTVTKVRHFNNAAEIKAFEAQFIKRGNIANDYGQALRTWQDKLNTLQRSYGERLHRLNVNDVRCVSESELFVEGIGNRLAALQAAYGADQEMAQECNYAIGAMRVYCLNHDTNYLVTEMTKVNSLRRKAARLHTHTQHPAPAPAMAMVRAPLELGPGPDNSGNDNAAAPAAPAGPGQAGDKVSMILCTPAAATAVIGNRTVGTGDTLDGFKIVAIAKDSVTVRSKAGATTALHLGDVLR